MKNFTSVEKMTKKQKKEYYKKFRNTWDINPVTRREQRGYNRRKFKKVNIDD